MKCQYCGYDMPDRAVICPECGEIVPKAEPEDGAAAETEETVLPNAFAMPFLSADVTKKTNSDVLEDPREKKIRAIQRRSRRIRLIVGLSVAAVLIAVGIVYGVFFSGYKLAVFRYVKGVDYCSGSMYASLVPDSYIDYLYSAYTYDRRDVKESLGNYFTYWNETYGTSGSMSYSIDSAAELNDTEIAELESDLKASYSITLEIKKAVTARITINDGGTTASEGATFIKVGFRWYCIEAMEDIDYVIQYDGYNVW